MQVAEPEPFRLFDASPNANVVLDRQLHTATANRDCLQCIASLQLAICTGQADTMRLLRFDVPRPQAEVAGTKQRY